MTLSIKMSVHVSANQHSSLVNRRDVALLIRARGRRVCGWSDVTFLSCIWAELNTHRLILEVF